MKLFLAKKHKLWYAYVYMYLFICFIWRERGNKTKQTNILNEIHPVNS